MGACRIATDMSQTGRAFQNLNGPGINNSRVRTRVVPICHLQTVNGVTLMVTTRSSKPANLTHIGKPTGTPGQRQMQLCIRRAVAMQQQMKLSDDGPLSFTGVLKIYQLPTAKS